MSALSVYRLELLRRAGAALAKEYFPQRARALQSIASRGKVGSLYQRDLDPLRAAARVLGWLGSREIAEQLKIVAYSVEFRIDRAREHARELARRGA